MVRYFLDTVTSRWPKREWTLLPEGGVVHLSTSNIQGEGDPPHSPGFFKVGVVPPERSARPGVSNQFIFDQFFLLVN